MRFMRLSGVLLLAAVGLWGQPKPGLRFEVSWAKPLDGHVVLILSTNNSQEPRFAVSEGLNTQQIFGADVTAGRAVVIDGATPGYPRDSLSQIPAGDYYVQAVLNVYETFHRASGASAGGRTLKLPMDQGEGQHWNRKPGNLYSEPAKIHVDPASTAVARTELTKTIAAIESPKDTKFIKHVRIESKLLSPFWGRPMYLGAVVLLPDGFDEHPNAHYPTLYYQGHYQSTFTAFRTEPPSSSGGGGRGGRGGGEYPYKLYQDWTSGRLPRMLIVITQDANPFYDDSYAVNSANVGPYGDALETELIPAIEKQFRGIGQGWARFLYGGSTGGWESLAVQMFYPDNSRRR